MGSNIEHINCNLCGSNDYKVIFKGVPEEKKNAVKKYKASGNDVSTDQVVKCNKCSLMYVNPRLKAESVVKGYSEGSDENFVSQAKGREMTFRKCMNLIEKHSKKGKILDIGTAAGSFLHVAKQHGWGVYGVEPNKWLCEWGKKNYGIDIKQGTIFDVKYPSNYFDVITLWDVIEHTPNPKEVLTEVNRILKKDGLLVVNYPDIGSWIARLMGSKWVFLLTVHLYYFTPKTIKAMLMKTGFKPFKIKSHFQKLSLGYLVYRMQPYSKALYKIGDKTVKLLGMSNLQIPYWLGQTLVLARKEKI